MDEKIVYEKQHCFSCNYALKTCLEHKSSLIGNKTIGGELCHWWSTNIIKLASQSLKRTHMKANHPVHSHTEMF